MGYKELRVAIEEWDRGGGGTRSWDMRDGAHSHFGAYKHLPHRLAVKRRQGSRTEYG